MGKKSIEDQIGKEIDTQMQKALTFQSKIMGTFYRGVMTSARVTEDMIRRYAEARGGLKMEFAAAELEIVKEIEHAFVKLQRLRSQHDAWLEAQKMMEMMKSGAVGRPARPAAPPRPAAAPPKPATATPKPAAPAPKPAAPAPRPATATPKPAAPSPRPAAPSPKPAGGGPRFMISSSPPKEDEEKKEKKE